MIPYFSLEMLCALLQLCDGRIPGTEDPYPASSNHADTHAPYEGVSGLQAGGTARPESSTNEGLPAQPPAGTSYFLKLLSDKR